MTEKVLVRGTNLSVEDQQSSMDTCLSSHRQRCYPRRSKIADTAWYWWHHSSFLQLSRVKRRKLKCFSREFSIHSSVRDSNTLSNASESGALTSETCEFSTVNIRAKSFVRWTVRLHVISSSPFRSRFKHLLFTIKIYLSIFVSPEIFSFIPLHCTLQHVLKHRKYNFKEPCLSRIQRHSISNSQTILTILNMK